MHRHRSKNRGFALLFVVMIVAVVAVAAAALLDIVEVDLLIVGEHSRSTVAKAVAEGAVKEFQADSVNGDLLPTAQSVGMETNYTGFVAGAFVRDPDNVGPGLTPLDETNSAYARGDGQQGYASTVRLLRTGPAINSGLNTLQAVIYEVRATSSVDGGRATSQVLAETYRYAATRPGTVGQMHAR